MGPAKAFETFKKWTYKTFEKDPGKMLVWTGAIGWVLSSAAQVGAIVFNEQIDAEEKEFLIPQEIADALVNILSFVFVTSSLTRLAKKLVSTGKWINTGVKDAIEMKKPALMNDLGKFTTNLDDYPELIKANENAYPKFKADIAVIASTVGAILSSNVITPVVRNALASEARSFVGSRHMKPIITRPTMGDYQLLASTKFSSGMRV